MSFYCCDVLINRFNSMLICKSMYWPEVLTTLGPGLQECYNHSMFDESHQRLKVWSISNNSWCYKYVSQNKCRIALDLKLKSQTVLVNDLHMNYRAHKQYDVMRQCTKKKNANNLTRVCVVMHSRFGLRGGQIRIGANANICQTRGHNRNILWDWGQEQCVRQCYNLQSVKWCRIEF